MQMLSDSLLILSSASSSCLCESSGFIPRIIVLNKECGSGRLFLMTSVAHSLGFGILNFWCTYSNHAACYLINFVKMFVSSSKYLWVRSKLLIYCPKLANYGVSKFELLLFCKMSGADAVDNVFTILWFLIVRWWWISDTGYWQSWIEELCFSRFACRIRVTYSSTVSNQTSSFCLNRSRTRKSLLTDHHWLSGQW